MMKVLLAVAMVQIIMGSQYVPFSKVPLGIPFGNKDGNLKIDLVYDPVCYDSRDFDNNIIKQLQSQLPSQVLSQITFRIIGQAKPWHLTAHKIIQGITLVHNTKGSDSALQCFRYFLNNVGDWDNTILETSTIKGFMDKLATKFEALSGIDQSVIRPQLQHTSQYDNLARKQFKHGIGNLHSGANPTIYINGAKVDNGFQMSLSEWKTLILSLV